MEQRKLNLIDIERQKLNLLLREQEEETQKWKDEQARIANEKQKKEDEETLQRFLEEKLKSTQSDRQEAAATRRFAAAVREDPSADNIINLLTNYQGTNGAIIVLRKLTNYNISI